MTVLPPLPVEIVTRAAQLDAAVKTMLGCREIALDTESNSFFRYPEQLCLIQIATRDKVYIIDTIALKEIAPLEAVLVDAAIIKVIHGADYDIRSLDRHYRLHIRNLYDTGIAARFAGLTRFGLAALTEELLCVTIPKSKQLQRADWGAAPALCRGPRLRRFRCPPSLHPARDSDRTAPAPGANGMGCRRVCPSRSGAVCPA